MKRRRPPFKVAALFAGIGGVEIGFEKAGHHTRLLCENDPAAAAVLKERFKRKGRKYPILHSDVRDLEELPKGVNFLTAGFPCQESSQAGRTDGINGTQSSLVSHVFRLLRTHDIPWLLLENVPFMLQLDRGEAMRHLVEQLESADLGYRWAYRIIDSRAFGLPQRRLRVFLLASKTEDPAGILFQQSAKPRQLRSHRGKACGFYWTEGTRGLGWAVDAVPTLKKGSTLGIPSPPAIWMPKGKVLIGKPDIRDAERLQGFDENWTEPAEDVAGGRGHRLRWSLVGNAVTTNVAEWIGRALMESTNQVPDRTAPLAEKAPWPLAAFGGPGRRVRQAVDCTTWPTIIPAVPLTEFLRYELEPLSPRATAGFYKRLSASTLDRPPEFNQALRAHYRRLTGEDLPDGHPATSGRVRASKKQFGFN